MLTCANCNRLTSTDYVNMTDQCPGCGTSPFPVLEKGTK